MGDAETVVPAAMELLLECSLCGARDLRIVRRAKRVYGIRQSMGKYTVSQCSGCGFAFTNPRPTRQSIGLFYENYFDAYMDGDEALYADRVAEVIGTAGSRPGRVLDVGCGTGQFLLGLQRAGWEAVGIEPDPVACEFARSKTGVGVRLGTLDTVSLNHDSFDVITLWHVLEHVHDPVSFIARCRELLKPRGWLLVELPNFASLQSRLFQNSWYALMLPEHLSHFSPATLRVVIERAGLTVLSIRPQFNRAGWGASARLILSDMKHGVTRKLSPASTIEGPAIGRKTESAGPVPRSRKMAEDIEAAMNSLGYVIESRLLRFREGTMNMRARCRKE